MSITEQPIKSGERILPLYSSNRAVDCAAYAHDASHYLIHPQALIRANDLDHIANILTSATEHHIPVTFRAGATSLSGQASGAGWLVDIRETQTGIEILNNGAQVRCQPGALLRIVNALLAPYGRRLGPDPASEIACTIGGVVANNSSGMTSGHLRTAYYTVRSVEFILPSGTRIDSAAIDADDRLRIKEPELHAGLTRLRDTIRSNPHHVETIKQQYNMKNTMGYGLNSFLDADRPVDILAKLLVGSEGTLAYIVNVVFDTVPDLPYAASALCIFDRIDQATDALAALDEAGAVALELLDAVSLRVSLRDKAVDDFLQGMHVDTHCGLLVEVQAETSDQLDNYVDQMTRVLGGLPAWLPTPLTTDASTRAMMWKTRKVLYSAVAGNRQLGTTPLLEDIVVPGPALTKTVLELQTILDKHGYIDPVIFGHAKDANLHFQINPRLDDKRELDTYEAFTEDLVELIIGYNGSLKAEHGTGRIMAPYVERQFGSALYQVMKEIKHLCDPSHILNPGVIISDDPKAHIKDLKTYPQIDPAIDRCVECGYCEPICPSRHTTTTPRQRIALIREMYLARQAGDHALADAIAADFEYMAIDTCAADSLCTLSCPMNIDTGKVMKGYRTARRAGRTQDLGKGLADQWGLAQARLRDGMKVANIIPNTLIHAGTKGMRSIIGERGRDWIPEVPHSMPGPGRARTDLTLHPAITHQIMHASAVWVPSCVSAIFGAPDQKGGATDALLSICKHAGISMIIPPQVDKLCCSTLWASKGLTAGADQMRDIVATVIEPLTDDGRLPVICEASSCSHGIEDIFSQNEAIHVEDATTFVAREVLPRVTIPMEKKIARVVVHPTCASIHMGIGDDVLAIARAAARDVIVPVHAGCCGSAGDRFMLHPELSEGATSEELAELESLGPIDWYLSSNRTCEMGLTERSGKSWRHVLEALAAVLANL
ncbi:FAD-binding and (Fe-S)-binding domain-containing protein [Stomatohabitans albus]|uniref:FAD-binding and (Fe-S)-binding domain-containing protein n=1 Tax=Stomatohabitans albus TaxID=3110766 RepID=UPI00300CD05D